MSDIQPDLALLMRQQKQMLDEFADFRDQLAVQTARLTAMESEIRDLRSEQPAMRAYVGARAGETEALMQQLFDRLNERLDQTERSVEERLRKLEGGA